VLPPEAQDEGKKNYVKELGADKTVCIGNGRNDRLMLREAALGIAVVLEEGAATETVLASDVVCTDAASALGLLLNPLRLAATLRV
jgi:soluble P-type ATPase